MRCVVLLHHNPGTSNTENIFHLIKDALIIGSSWICHQIVSVSHITIREISLIMSYSSAIIRVLPCDQMPYILFVFVVETKNTSLSDNNLLACSPSIFQSLVLLLRPTHSIHFHFHCGHDGGELKFAIQNLIKRSHLAHRYRCD